MRTTSRTRRLRCLGLGVLALLLLANTGCLVFEKQTVVILTPEKGTEAKVLLVYEGFHAAGGNANKDLEKAKASLQKLAAGNQLFYLLHPIATLEMADHNFDSERTKQTKAFFRNNLQVDKLVFFENKAGQLCGYQVLTIPNTLEFLARVNRAISQEILRDGLKNPSKEVDEATVKMILQAAKDEHPWIAVEPGRLSVTVPASHATIHKVKEAALGIKYLDAMINELEQKPEGNGETTVRRKNVLDRLQTIRYGAKVLNDNPLNFEHGKNQVRVSLGYGEGEPIRCGLPKEEIQYNQAQDKDIREYAKGLKVQFRDKTTVEEIIAEFVK